MNAVLVMKFGGTSVGGARSLNNAVRQVARETHALPFVVVSALSGVTDLLVLAAQAIDNADDQLLEKTLDTIRARHIALATEVLDPIHRHSFGECFYADFGHLVRLCRKLQTQDGISQVDTDQLLSFGERFSSRLFALKLKTYTDRAHWCDARNFIITDPNHGNARPDERETRQHLRQWIQPLIAQGRIVVTQGFVGATRQGRTTTLGRGGSDFTATFLGAMLPAAHVQIWTDVNGVYTSDPNRDPQARHIPELSLDDAYALAEAGAKVIYPPCLAPLRGRAIPLKILNTWRPDLHGTVITADPAPQTFAISH